MATDDGARSRDGVDLVVLGSGAAGLTAAVTAAVSGARVVVLEKSDRFGGTSAWSGGAVWIPCNPLQEQLGVEDSREEALTYLESLSLGLIDPDLAAAFVDGGPEMVRFLLDRTPVEFEICKEFPDYHPEHPGGKPAGGRSLQCPLYPFDELGDWADRVSLGRQMAAGAAGTHVLLTETPLGHAAPAGVPATELARRLERDERGLGQSLVGRLLRGCLDHGVDLRASHRATGLVVEDGRVVGVRADAPDGPVEVRAAAGVVLATGGFEWDEELARTFLRGPLQRPVSIETNTGDGLRMAMEVGVTLGNMREAWWTATIDVDGPDGRTIPWMINGERTRPRTIMVNRSGRRFANESANYNAFGAAFHVIDATTYAYANLPAWMLMDRGYLDRYSIGGWDGTGATPGWVVEAPSLPELAERLGIDPDALVATVARWNRQVEAGVDDDFGRGRSAHDQWWGDPTLTGSVRANLGPLDTGPYYAVEVHAAALGTKGGPRTDGEGRVLGLDGAAVPGLYAAGNVMASVMGMTYGGAGGTLGPAMTFGFLAARHAVGTLGR